MALIVEETGHVGRRRELVSPRGWASCLLGRLGASLSGALSAAAGLYLNLLSQGVS